MANKVFVGLSGGVDSAVSAALLQERGFDVVGVFIKIWRPEFIECTWKEDRLDAMRVCAALSIPYREIDLSAEYKKEVVDAMVSDYARGVTPNPDIICNRQIKFGAFAQWAREQGASAIATGHYARIRQNAAHFELLRGIDPEKDQSYFLFRLGQQDLARTIFPVGGMQKSDVRAKAAALRLPVAQKRDSQGLCFVGDVSMPDFLRRFVQVVRGDVLDTEGKVIGQHEGAALYTVGERHGFSLSQAGANASAQYVTAIDIFHNTITVSPQRERAARSGALLSALHWVHHEPPAAAKLEVQVRYRERPTGAALVHQGGNMGIVFQEPHIAPPGQSLVVYQGSLCLGGGTIGRSSPFISRNFPLHPANTQLSDARPVKTIVRRVQ